MIVAVTMTVLFLGASSAAVWLWRSGARPPAGTEVEPARTVTAPAGADPTGAPLPPSSLQPPPSQPSSPAPAATPSVLPGGAPAETLLTRRGAITIVDLGVNAKKDLPDELALQRAAAQAEGETMLLMMTQYGNKLFEDFDAAIPHPLMQSALARVRVVRVDGRYFASELEEMGVPTDSFPWFFLLAPDLAPRDGINGGEWDDDVPRNIAPVLGAFLKGTYTARRQRWTPPRSKAMPI